MAKALIIIHDGYTDTEATTAYDRLLEEDFTVHVATPTGNNPVGEKGWDRLKAQLSTETALLFIKNPEFAKFANFEMANFTGLWDILILPGGVKSIEKVRLDAPTIEIIKLHYAADKIIASCCHGAQLLIEADLCEDRLISGYASIKKDIENAGGAYADFVAVCDNIVSAPHYNFNGKWMGAVMKLWHKRQRDT